MAGKYEYENLAGKYEYENLAGKYEYENLAGKAGLVEGLASSPHHLSNEDSLPAPGVSTVIVGKVMDNLTLGRYLPLPISALALVLLTQEPWALKKPDAKYFCLSVFFLTDSHVVR